MSRSSRAAAPPDEVLALSVARGPGSTNSVSCGRGGKVALGEPTSGGIDVTAEEQNVDLAAASSGSATSTALLHEWAGAERSARALEAGRRSVLRPGEDASGIRVTGRVDGSGDVRQFRSDPDADGAGTHRPIRMHPFPSPDHGHARRQAPEARTARRRPTAPFGPDELTRPVARIPTGR